MTNEYFNYTSPIARFTTADASRINSAFKSVEVAFEKFPTPTELSQGSRNYSVATNIGNAYSVTVPFDLLSYNAGLDITFLAGVANTTPSATLNVNGLGPVTIKRFDNTNLLVSDIRALSINSVVFDGLAFRITSVHGGTESLATTSATAAATSASQAAASALTASQSATTAVNSATTASLAATSSSAMLLASSFGLRNLFLNPLFWLSQRLGTIGVSANATVGAGVFFRDRWKSGPTGLTFNVFANPGITIVAGSIQQVVQGRNMPFTNFYTLSWIGTATATIDGIPVSNGGSISLIGYDNHTVTFSVGTVYRPQLEFGSTKTTAELRSADLERTLCAQYYQKSYNELVNPGTISSPNYTGAGETPLYAPTTANFAQGHIPLKTKMRGIPAITIYSPRTGATGKIMKDSPLGDINSVVANIGDSSFFVASLNVDLVAGTFYRIHWVADAEL